MFGLKKKEQKPLWIMGKDVMEIIWSDYEEGIAFTLVEFHYQGGAYLLGSCVVPPEAEEKKENIVFVFQDQVYQDYQEFQEKADVYKRQGQCDRRSHCSKTERWGGDHCGGGDHQLPVCAGDQGAAGEK